MVKLRNRLPKFLLHFPLIQVFTHFSFFMELVELDRLQRANMKVFKSISNEEMDNLINNKKKIIEQVLIYDELTKQRSEVFQEVVKFKLFEAFLEGSPQIILQIYIVAQTGFSSWIQIISLIISIISTSYSAHELYQAYPTKVNCIL